MPQSDTTSYVPSTKIGRVVQYVKRNSKNAFIIVLVFIAVFALLALIFAVPIAQFFYEKSTFWSILQILSGIFCLAWFITGSVWIFRAKGKVQYYYPYYESTYCDYTLFNFAFGTLFINYGLLFGHVCNNSE
ncbi:unnamed protein product, partial [Rotaria sordida]